MEKSKNNLNIVIPWSLTHYIPLNGYHPLYRALFEHKPTNITLTAWDNVLLSKNFKLDATFRKSLLTICDEEKNQFGGSCKSDIQRELYEHMWYPNATLTKLLPGDIEFHHTAPCPSMKRYFVFHCESFKPIFFPFGNPKEQKLERMQKIKDHYKEIFEHDLCLGIFSHLQETLNDIDSFFNSEVIRKKLFLSRIGLPDVNLSDNMFFNSIETTSEIRFLFINSAHQNPHNFFNRGGHLALRFLKKLHQNNIYFKAYMRCAKPENALLQAKGVDIDFIKSMSGKQIIWIENHISNSEMNNLIASAHFMLIPSLALHSVSIMQAMRYGAIPIVTDTVGTSLYVKDNFNGIMLKGFSQISQKEEKDKKNDGLNKQNNDLDESLVNQLEERIQQIIEKKDLFTFIQKNAIETAKTQFSGQAFASHFWNSLTDLVSAKELHKHNIPSSPLQDKLNKCYADSETFIKFFESPPQPLTKIYTGDSYLVELGGAFAHVEDRTMMGLHDWSFIAEYIHHSPKIIFANTLSELVGYSLTNSIMAKDYKNFFLIQKMSKKLDRYPRLKKPIKAVYKRLIKTYIKRKPEINDTIQGLELCVEGFHGYNILKHEEKYYAILQTDGAFSLNKIKFEVYSSFFVADSLEEIMHQITHKHMQNQVKYSLIQKMSKKLDRYPRLKKPIKAVYKRLIKTYIKRKPEINDTIQGLELCVEGFHGYNILKHEEKYYAILQTDGAFSLNKIKFEVYSSFFVADSLEEIMHQITHKHMQNQVKYSLIQKMSKKLDRYPRIKQPLRAIYRLLVKKYKY